jgi:hypothetical protein
MTENGLSKDAALKAMTLGAAEILGVSDRLGSIETGKIANLVVTRGDVLGKDKAVTHVFVDGKFFEQKPPAPAARGTGSGPAPAAGASNAAAGTWNITIEAPGQPLPLTLILSQSGSTVTGSMQSPTLGNSQIKNGNYSAGTLSFDAAVTFGGQSLELNVSGKINGNQVSGSVTTPMGAVPFSGTKAP